ncbi:uncharacterized protein G2W53_044908 [Senna tora]|uniref:Uncharacterized protein n=1 Tax=Senna tora TaxID=362788 RepID=A0A834SCQ5_9FABA|nr:uncharacterized protein G2W53_044908 [Senna tora]
MFGHGGIIPIFEESLGSLTVFWMSAIQRSEKRNHRYGKQCSKLGRSMGRGGYGSEEENEKMRKQSSSSKKMGDAKAKASAGMDKAKAAALVGADKAKVAAIVGAMKVKTGTSAGFKWVKSQYQKRTSSSK